MEVSLFCGYLDLAAVLVIGQRYFNMVLFMVLVTQIIMIMIIMIMMMMMMMMMMIIIIIMQF